MFNRLPKTGPNPRPRPERRYTAEVVAKRSPVCESCGSVGPVVMAADASLACPSCLWTQYEPLRRPTTPEASNGH